ncbi:hypothetical protein DCAR_0518754 [Daucus carota subsp. sativus]|uniref:Uncharacterized protein n=1 Tax=Daucus carota subsp. sativus TaxID=79200 RepID=A0A164XGN1_DAUCS|nr:hypothetical protein DCAR_0518754 [Daucus carota subsp. sativus]
MGGRPGQAVCKRLFERRGVRVDKLWRTKILQASINLVVKKTSIPELHTLRTLLLQAGDTDISALVENEKNSPHRFEFFMGLVGDQPICARTAWALARLVAGFLMPLCLT